MVFHPFTRQKYSKDLRYWILPKKFYNNLMNKISKGSFLREYFPLVLFYFDPFGINIRIRINVAHTSNVLYYVGQCIFFFKKIT